MATIPTMADPCGRAAALRALRDEVITGGGVVEIESESGNGLKRRVRYSTADLAGLDREIAAADAACGGARPRRRTFYPQTSKGL
ncbi:hypothetical protein [Marinibacterium profundimaris]|uniref:GpW protein n=1 Tax=Marinibacterium profundimaris TaxID=1679460 RepID=A0A225ND30_9RHOB|nr:hypothetical protein [Marinibacterium profundimaris]OWU67798.1 hypothetical protein ATO3_25550 [Marinibacterium profundimaris]